MFVVERNAFLGGEIDCEFRVAKEVISLLNFAAPGGTRERICRWIGVTHRPAEPLYLLLTGFPRRRALRTGYEWLAGWPVEVPIDKDPTHQKDGRYHPEPATARVLGPCVSVRKVVGHGVTVSRKGARSRSPARRWRASRRGWPVRSK